MAKSFHTPWKCCKIFWYPPFFHSAPVPAIKNDRSLSYSYFCPTSFQLLGKGDVHFTIPEESIPSPSRNSINAPTARNAPPFNRNCDTVSLFCIQSDFVHFISFISHSDEIRADRFKSEWTDFQGDFTPWSFGCCIHPGRYIIGSDFTEQPLFRVIRAFLSRLLGDNQCPICVSWRL